MAKSQIQWCMHRSKIFKNLVTTVDPRLSEPHCVSGNGKSVVNCSAYTYIYRNNLIEHNTYAQNTLIEQSFLILDKRGYR